MKKRILISIFLTIAASAAGFRASAQSSASRFLAAADSARMVYDFPGAVDLCNKAMALMDSSSIQKIQDRVIPAQNGLSMMGFCSTPAVVAKRTFPLKDFFLFYPLPNRSWRKTPNQLDSLSNAKDGFAAATYCPEDASQIFWSAKDEDGVRNIYTSQLKDSLWSAAALVSEYMTSSQDEIFPMMSTDGKTLYFASKGLYGMGGYDLYQSSWNSDTKEWEQPVNMGFPYSSPYDDFLYINTDDGKYSIFASNRECSKDSVCIYVLEFDAVPVRTAVSDVNELRELASLRPKDDLSRMDNASAVSGNDEESAGTKLYLAKMKEVRMMRDSVSRFSKNLDALRQAYSTSPEEKKSAIASEITKDELLLPSINEALSKSVKQLQEIEMEFLMKGIVFDTKKLQAQVDREIVGASSGYTFTKNGYGPVISLKMKKVTPSFDYAFKILPEGQFAENNTLPSGLVYQIQISTQPRKATVSELKGLSPVFEKLNPSGKYTYCAGLFRSYNDALANISKVKGCGFRDAIIVAFNNGRSMGIAEARNLEAKVRSEYMVKINPANGTNLSEDALAAIQDATDKDLVKTVENGAVVYMVGPFDDRTEAQNVASAAKEAGEGNASIVSE